MAQMDPSHSVPQELMAHVHLVSSYRYPTVPRLDVNEVIRWLMNAPQVAKDRAPFFWTYLDKPADGTILLTWQPLQRLNSNFATDGFIWAPPEQVYKQDLGNGLILEIYYLKAGYIPGEQFALHARRRFRLVPAPGHANPPQIDISLFIVHYGPSDPNDRIPANMVPYDERVNAIMQQRHYLLRGGQIRRKEFMLSDRVNWPLLPELTRQQMAPHMGPQMMARGVPQQMAYPPQPVAPPPAKRARHNTGPGAAQVVGPPGVTAGEQLEEEEDMTRGDMFDQMTQREVSLSRFKQSYEWMEEIMSSAYRIGQIEPSDLNLGRKGELAALTEGIFTAQAGEAFAQAPDKPYIGTLDEGLADKFRKRVDDYIKSTKADMGRIKTEHEKTMASLTKGSVFALKEAELRDMSVEPAKSDEMSEPGSEAPRPAATQKHMAAQSGPVFKKAVDDVSRDMEAATGRRIVQHPNVRRVQQGGYQAPEPEPEPQPQPTQPQPQTQHSASGPAHMSRQPSHNSGVMMGDVDVDMGGTAAGLLDQMHSGLSSTSTPVNNAPTPQAHLSAAQSAAVTPSNALNSPAPSHPQPPPQPHPRSDQDVIMQGTEEPQSHANLNSTSADPDQGPAGDDWVMVPKDYGAQRDQSAAAASAPWSAPEPAPESTTRQDQGPLESRQQQEPGQGSKTQPFRDAPASAPEPSAPAAAPRPQSAAGTPAPPFDQNDFSSLGDLDTAGDALAGFDAPELDGAAGDLGDGLDLQMDMDDSAFGDAFHGVSASDTPAADEQNQDV